MDPAAESVAAYKTQNPEDEEDDGDSPKHDGLLRELSIVPAAVVAASIAVIRISEPARPSGCKLPVVKVRLPMRIKYEDSRQIIGGSIEDSDSG